MVALSGGVFIDEFFALLLGKAVFQCEFVIDLVEVKYSFFFFGFLRVEPQFGQANQLLEKHEMAWVKFTKIHIKQEGEVLLRYQDWVKAGFFYLEERPVQSDHVLVAAELSLKLALLCDFLQNENKLARDFWLLILQ